MESKINSFEKYWPIFLKSHSKPLTRKWHFWAFLMVLFAPIAGLIKGTLGPAILLVIAGFLTAWYSHIIIQENKPTTWTSNPLWAIRGNLKMFSLILSSKLEKEFIMHNIEKEKN